MYRGVWAPSITDKTTVAIKQLKLKKLAEWMVSDFISEVTIQSKLKHQNIVKLIGVTDEEPYCIVMGFMSQGTLRNLLDRDGHNPDSLQWVTRYAIAQDLASGLAYLHS